ncbi:nuclear transport factor 2 family protein [Nocardioides alcanivorans]|uniref:nuclear transport factor 2 family protein n=1 Tax=Nocardioides alcanivorans TaxID=2897352 RepID=UPI001F373169|nr:nuclear transport factor 2 family protein [Nocardioides alcanivorans]
MDLVAIESIRQLKYRYFRTLDNKQWDQFGDCLAEDIRADYGTKAMGKPLHFESRAEVVAYMAKHMTDSLATMHVAQHPEITVDGDTASATWAFEDTVIASHYNCLIRGAGYYTDTYRLDADGQWRITSTEYERLYEYMTSLEDTPSFKFLANKWA